MVTGDIVPSDVRRRMMQAVRRAGTGPELIVRHAVQLLGVRCGGGSRKLPGSPDLVNLRRRWAIFVHGCFWHGHQNCKKTKGGADGRIPTSNQEFWSTKLAANRERDARKARELRRRGLRVLTIWECECRSAIRLESKLRRFFSLVSGPEPPRKVKAR
jgi:DNA mismatch endonuclease (patch repair protein)